MPGDPVVGSTILRRPAIASPNYVTGVSGWTINQDGSAEFNNLTFRGTLQGSEFIINSSGSFFYSPSEAAGNLIASIAPASGTDAFGNNYVAGIASYGGSFAMANTNAIIQFYTGSLAAGWSSAAAIESDGSEIQVVATSTLVLSGPSIQVGTGAQTVQINGSSNTASAGLTDGTINGSSSNAGLTNGTIAGTSGAASAGTAHTHGAGSYAVSNGQHNHSSGSYAVANGSHNHTL